MIEHVPFGRCPTRPPTNFERLASFRFRYALAFPVPFNGRFQFPKAPALPAKDSQL